ncbi:MAG: MBL fold metallo-hydrolase [Parachlamydiaceae bacterium]|nr:MBL fold metallo-hydrolase [Parachlamydiaceae bacterium]
MTVIQAFPSGPFDTNAYIVACQNTKKAAIIDPAPESGEKIRAYLSKNQLVPEKILLTHSHWDHIGDVALCKRLFNIPVYIHENDRSNLEVPGSDGLPCWINIEPVKADGFFDEGDTISVGDIKLQVINTPGHTPGGVCFYIKDHNILFSGDTLFKGTIGNLSFPTCVPDLMWGSLAKLTKLPPQTKVYPGHGATTTISAEHWLPRAKELFGE